jgi:hypothetical protein
MPTKVIKRLAVAFVAAIAVVAGLSTAAQAASVSSTADHAVVQGPTDNGWD